MRRKRLSRWQRSPPRECWCPPWWLSYRRPWCWLPMRAKRYLHVMLDIACTPRWLAEQYNLIDDEGRWLFRTREEYSAYLKNKEKHRVLP
jgi:hypothetical protein